MVLSIFFFYKGYFIIFIKKKVLEKAYAKLYGNFQNIDAGFVSFALADLTGGLPEMLYLSEYKNK